MYLSKRKNWKSKFTPNSTEKNEEIFDNNLSWTTDFYLNNTKDGAQMSSGLHDNGKNTTNYKQHVFILLSLLTDEKRETAQFKISIWNNSTHFHYNCRC